MASDFTLSVLTPDKCFLSGEAQEIVFDTPAGRLGIMAGHMSMIAAVAEGTIEILIDGEWKTAAVSQGFADIGENKVELFVDTVEWSDEIDTARAREALERAELRLKGNISRLEYVRTRAAVARALARLKAAGFSSRTR